MPDLFPSGSVPTHLAHARRRKQEHLGARPAPIWPAKHGDTAAQNGGWAVLHGGAAQHGGWVALHSGRPARRRTAYTAAARAAQRDWRYSTWRGTPKHLDRFCAVNTSGSGPAASTEPRRSSMAWVNPSGTSST